MAEKRQYKRGDVIEFEVTPGEVREGTVTGYFGASAVMALYNGRIWLVVLDPEEEPADQEGGADAS